MSQHKKFYPFAELSEENSAIPGLIKNTRRAVRVLDKI